eukprot:725554-Prymnesium_polylepis.1
MVPASFAAGRALGPLYFCPACAWRPLGAARPSWPPPPRLGVARTAARDDRRRRTLAAHRLALAARRRTFSPETRRSPPRPRCPL